MTEAKKQKQKPYTIPVSKSLYDEQNVTKKLKVCAYCRVSSDLEGQLHSYQAQYEYYDHYIRKNENWEFAGMYADEGISGTSKNKRLEFLQMVEDCKNGKINLILTKSITRFARNVVDCITTIRFLKSLGIAVYFEKERINTLEARNERSIAVWAAVAQEEAVNTSKNAHWASVKRFQNGTFELSKIVYGYQKNDNGELIIDEAQAAVVRAIAADYLNGMGTLSIAQKLNQNGIPAPNQGRWFDSTVRRILQNEKITGDFLMQKTITNGSVPFKREINRGQAPKYLIKEDHEGILTREERERIEWIMNSRRSIRNHHVWEGREESNVLQGKLICAECGSVLGRERGRPTGRYKGTVWRCPTHHKQSERCSLKPIKEEQIQQAFIDLYHKLKQCQEIILKPLINHLKEIPVSEHVRRNLEEMDYQCTELYMQSQVLLKMKAEGYVDMDFFVEKDRSIRQEIKDIRSRQGEIRKSIDNTSQWKTIEHLLDCLNIHIGRMEQFDAYLFSNMVEIVKVKSQTEYEFQLFGGLKL